MNENLETMEVVPYGDENKEIAETEERSGIGMVLAMIIGSGVTLAAFAGGKKLKKLWNEHKNKKEREGVVINGFSQEETDDSEDEKESK